MKIFGWMQRKLQYQRVAHENNAPDVIDEENGVMKSVTLAVVAGEREKGIETEAPLLHHNILLTIGTFGYCHSDALLLASQQSKEENKDMRESDDPTEGEPFNPSTLETSKPEPKAQEFDHKNSKQEAAVAVISLVEELEEEITSVEPLLLKDMNRNVAEKRTTLADLFAAEGPLSSSPAAALHVAHTCENIKKTTALKKMKKKKKSKAEETKVTKAKTMHGMIARMLKKKIYPDVARGEELGHGQRVELDGTVNLTC